MIALLLCLLSFASVYAAARRDLVKGLTLLITVGYAYGIVRANVLQPASHFTFDAAVAALFFARLSRSVSEFTRWREAVIRRWLLLLIGWPLLLLLIPVQDPLVQMVGFRGNVFFLPFLLIGARMTGEDLSRLARNVAILNLVAFGFAAAEFVIGIEWFFPPSSVTEIMYRSKDVAGNTAHRIPATFSSAHAYGGTMVMSMPLLLGAFTEHRIARTQRLQQLLIVVALLASGVGILMSAARLHAIVLFTLLLITTITGRISMGGRIAWILLIVAGGAVAASNARLQRFTTLENQEYVQHRVSGSVNSTFIDYARAFPLGNGLGGGGTSMPYFLAHRLRDPVMLENEYGRIMLEQGLPGLIIWLCFIVWLIVRGMERLRLGTWPTFRTLAWVVCSTYLLLGGIGLGLLTSIPQSALMLLWLGFLTARESMPSRAVTGGGYKLAGYFGNPAAPRPVASLPPAAPP